MTIRVKYSGWTVTGAEIGRRYEYFEGDRAIPDYAVEIGCTLQPSSFGLLKRAKTVHTLLHFVVSPPLFPQDENDEAYLIARLTTRNADAETGFVMVRARPLQEGTFVDATTQDDAWKFLRAIKDGTDMILVLMANPNDTILKLPMPNDSEFGRIYETCRARLT